MRSMEEGSRGEFSEDEHPSTDASEDSVEVRVSPIAKPHAFPHNLSRLPRKFRKAFEKSCFREEVLSPTEFKEESTSPIPDRRETPSPSDESSLTSVTTGRGSPSGPHSLSSTARVRGSRRKLSEPRRVVEHDGNKRTSEEDWLPRKIPRTEGTSGVSHFSPRVSTQPSVIGTNPFLGHFVPPHLLLPPAWGPIARHPYAHLVGLAPQLGLLPAPPYPLLPIFPPRVPIAQPPSPKPSSSDSNHKSNKLPNSSSSRRINGLSESPPLQISKLEVPPSATDIRIVQQARVPLSDTLSTTPSDTSVIRKASSRPSKNFLSVESILAAKPKEEDKEEVLLSRDTREEDSPSPDGTIQSLLQNHQKQKQRNYKNMTRERRIEANARERTRVHTISAAFETLRQAVPSFSHNQKLSKLSVLRIASAYILSLSRLAGLDYSEGGTNPSFEECVDLTTKTIQIEGKAKKKRED